MVIGPTCNYSEGGIDEKEDEEVSEYLSRLTRYGVRSNFGSWLGLSRETAHPSSIQIDLYNMRVTPEGQSLKRKTGKTLFLFPKVDC